MRLKNRTASLREAKTPAEFIRHLEQRLAKLHSVQEWEKPFIQYWIDDTKSRFNAATPRSHMAFIGLRFQRELKTYVRSRVLDVAIFNRAPLISQFDWERYRPFLWLWELI